MIQRALISVYDKEGIVDFAKELSKLNIELVSTGGTYRLLKENNIKVKSVEEVTDFPEILNGRIKTLHPNIFAGILADRENQDQVEELKKYNIQPFDLVVVNLYPFCETILKEDVTIEEAIEQIDIGGVSLIRASAKNFKCVNILTNTEQYNEYLDLLITTNYQIPFEYSQNLARLAFRKTSDYDNSIQKYLNIKKLGSPSNIPEFLDFRSGDIQELRYGENPHQKGILLKDNFEKIFKILHGKELSYNNFLDIEAACNLIYDFKDEKPTCAIIKHGNPSGVAVSSDTLNAYINAFKTDTLSPFGGIIIFNKKLDFKTSLEVDKLFSEIILAPDFDEDALELLKKKKNRRLINYKFVKETYEYRKISGGLLYQERDDIEVKKVNLKFVTNRRATSDEIEDMLFANKVVKHTKSNAVVFVKDKRTLAIGGGQPSRIDSTKIAISKAKYYNQELRDSVAASDAFFPFADGLIEIAEAGTTAMIQPGGSLRDEEVIKAADDYEIAMAFTGIRHFKH